MDGSWLLRLGKDNQIQLVIQDNQAKDRPTSWGMPLLGSSGCVSQTSPREQNHILRYLLYFTLRNKSKSTRSWEINQCRGHQNVYAKLHPDVHSSGLGAVLDWRQQATLQILGFNLSGNLDSHIINRSISTTITQETSQENKTGSSGNTKQEQSWGLITQY